MAWTKSLAYRILDGLGLEIDGFPNQGLAAFGYWLHPRRSKFPRATSFRGAAAVERCLELDIATVLDVGSGGGEQAGAFAAAGRDVTCVDYGISTYAREGGAPAGCKMIVGDFNALAVDRRYDLVWSSHTLEHQPNVGLFLAKLNAFCRDGGWVCVTVPVCHRAMWGGHLTLWTPGLLAYNLALTGIDLSAAELIHGRREFSLLFQPTPAALPTLAFDSGDIAALGPLLPSWCREGEDSW
jgi:SAM-dependent methyltransferase